MPMDLSRVKALCDAAAPPMRAALWCADVRLDLVYGPCSDPDWSAECERNAPYNRATITIDPARHEDEGEVLDSLRHEVLHLVLTEFDVYANIVQSNIDEGDGPAQAVEERAWTLACERTINRLENVLDGLGWSSRALAGHDVTCAGCGHAWRGSAPDGTTDAECPRCGTMNPFPPADDA